MAVVDGHALRHFVVQICRDVCSLPSISIEVLDRVETQ